MSLDPGVVAVLVEVEVAELRVAAAELSSCLRGARSELYGGAGGSRSDGQAVEGGVWVVTASDGLLTVRERVGDTDLARLAGGQVGLQVELMTGQGGLSAGVWAWQ